MKNITSAALLALASISTSVWAAEETYYNPQVPTTDNRTLYVEASSVGEFCEREGYSDWKNDSFEYSVASNDYFAVPGSGNTWNSVFVPSSMTIGYVAKVTCYTPAPQELTIAPTITVNGMTVPMAERAQLPGWTLPSYVIRCSGLGYTPRRQTVEPLTEGFYAEYVTNDWLLKFKANDGTSINVTTSMTCFGTQ